MEKQLKKLSLLLIAMLCITLTACSDKDDDKKDEPNIPTGNSDSLVGTWDGYCEDDQEEYATLVFRTDGSGWYQENDGEKDYFDNYRVKNGILEIMWEDEYSYEQVGKITINGNRFRINLRDEWDDEDDWWVFKKR